ncbi:hypothetical protein PG993_013200 [Apiospora rasikravindrae]|uniref:Zn(2)-C6 fungal-type domain-containing protein n=1 Tax=Apiospora rasikravindrae TaxID=990691 RepID=A0ABR1RXG6_9PEZI
MSYKALAPRPAYGHPSPDPTPPSHSKRKPAPKVACETCRTRKTAILQPHPQCDGQRPSCSKCTRKLLPCRYSSTGERLKERLRELQASLDSHVELVKLLSATPEGNIVQVLRDLRAAPEPLAYLASATNEAGTPHGRRSPTTDSSIAGSLHSPSRVDLEFDRLTTRYQIAYPALPPIPLATVNPQPRFADPVPKPRLDRQPAISVGGSVSGSPATLMQGQPRSTDPLDNLASTLAERLRLTRCIAGTSSLRPATPPLSNDLAATVISAYLEVDHPLYAFFDADLFVHDLVNLGITFCSPFLVSSLLSHACYTCAAIDSRTSALGHAFFQQAEMLYRAERMSDLLPNSSALAIFSLVCTLQCRDDLALEAQRLSRQMGERMRLFGVPDDESHRAHFNDMPPHMKIASAQAAWGLYNWLSLRTFFYEAKPIDYPPILPIPGEHHDSSRRATTPTLDWPAHSLPTWMGCAFPALCTLWALAQEIAAVYSTNREQPLCKRVSLAFAESKYTKLLEWAATLRPELQRREHNTPIDTLLFHMYLHTIILILFRPFLQGPQRDQKLRVFNSADSSPSAIYEVSINQMKHIVLQHHLDFPDKLFSSFAYAGYMQLGSAIAGQGPSRSQRREQRFYFDLCMCFFQDAYLQHALAKPIAQGLLCMALESGLLRASKVRKFLDQFQKREDHHDHSGSQHRTSTIPSSSATQAQAIVHFELAVVDADAARAHRLASRLEDLMMFDEFTNTTTSTVDDEDDDEDDCSYDKDDHYENESDNERDYESSAQSGSVLGSDLYRTPASDACTDVNNCWMDGCDWS